MDALPAGLIDMELRRGDGGLAAFIGVHCGLAMKTIAMLGSEEQKSRWLPPTHGQARQARRQLVSCSARLPPA